MKMVPPNINYNGSAEVVMKVRKEIKFSWFKHTDLRTRKKVVMRLHG